MRAVSTATRPDIEAVARTLFDEQKLDPAAAARLLAPDVVWEDYTTRLASGAADVAAMSSDGMFGQAVSSASSRAGMPRMGLFDSLKSAFANEEFKEDDQRVRASLKTARGLRFGRPLALRIVLQPQPMCVRQI